MKKSKPDSMNKLLEDFQATLAIFELEDDAIDALLTRDSIM
jgi:hypothetical protein